MEINKKSGKFALLAKLKYIFSLKPRPKEGFIQMALKVRISIRQQKSI